MPTRTRQHGFTIIELMVTMSILGLMLFLVNELFNDTSQAVQTSVQSSKTIATSRSVNEQLTQDLNAMVGPGLTNDGGYIVIIQQRIQNATMIDPRNLSEVQVDELRTDQLLFIRDAEGLKSMTPATANSYGSNFVGQPGDRAKVWYGHALRTLPNGQPRTPANATTTLGGSATKLGRIGSNWIFGRQAMLFNPTDVAATPAPLKLSDDTVGFTYAVQGYDESAVNGAAGFTGTAQTYKGLTDITVQNYGPAATAGTLLYQLSDASTAANHNAFYLNTAYPDANFRLRVNTAPDADDTNYAAWAIAQGHPIFAQSCSEIIVDFAADLNGNGRIDRVFGGNADSAGSIWWYDTLRQPLLTDGTAASTTGWTQQSSPSVVPQPWINLSANAKAFIFRVDDDTSFEDAGGTVGTAGTAHSYWPYLIRIRYRLHDTRGRLESNYAAALTDGLDNDGDGGADAADPGNDEDRIAGRWFERIISVPRP